MTQQQKNKYQKIILGVLILAFVLMLGHQYLPMIELPTDSHIQEEQNRLKSLRGDLAVMKKMNQDWQAELAELRGKSGQFWVRTRTTMPVEQEVLEEFNKIARLASVNIQSREARLIKTNNVNYIQEVELRMEMRGVSMREVTRLLRELENARHSFSWSSCKIEPDNLQKPTGVKFSGRLRAFVLNEEAVKVLGGDVSLDDVALDTSKSKSSKATGKGTVKGKTSTRKVVSGGNKGGNAK
ncbi:MAG: hypothetical protein IJS08_12810 [Victivallales bacterium]|nr:hypothetical protein [Victivallales bacterium]